MKVVENSVDIALDGSHGVNEIAVQVTKDR
jgi:hypothetical protein